MTNRAGIRRDGQKEMRRWKQKNPKNVWWCKDLLSLGRLREREDIFLAVSLFFLIDSLLLKALSQYNRSRGQAKQPLSMLPNRISFHAAFLTHKRNGTESFFLSLLLLSSETLSQDLWCPRPPVLYLFNRLTMSERCRPIVNTHKRRKKQDQTDEGKWGFLVFFGVWRQQQSKRGKRNKNVLSMSPPPLVFFNKNVCTHFWIYWNCF